MEYLSRLAAAADAEDAKRDADAAALTAEETSGPSTPLSQPDVSEREEVTPTRSKPSPPVAEPWVDRLELLPNVVSNGGDRISETELGGLTFNADFDSGNVVRVCQRSDAEAAARWKEYNLQGKPAEDFRNPSSDAHTWRSRLTQNGTHRTARPPPFFTLWARADGEGTPHATRSRSWFCFSVKGAQAGRALQFEVRTSNQEKLFRHDMRPVYRSLPSQPEWRPLRTAATFIVKPRRPGAPPISNPLLERETEEDRILEEQRYGPRDAFAIQFTHKVDTPAGCSTGAPTNETLYFAFCYPHSYSELMAELAWLDALFQRPTAHIAPSAVTRLLPMPPAWLLAIVDWIPTWLGGRAQGAQNGSWDRTVAASAPTSRRESSAESGVSGQPQSRAGGGGWFGGAMIGMPAPHSRPVSDDERQQLLRFNQARLRSVAHKAAVEASKRPDDGPLSRGGMYVYTAAAAPSPAAALPPSMRPVDAPESLASIAEARAYAEAQKLKATAAYERVSAELAKAAAQTAASLLPTEAPSNVYYRRELLARSIEGRRIDLLTITGTGGASEEHEEPLPPPLMPEGGGRPLRFPSKRYILITARVHPGETPASHVLDGLLQFLLRADDPRAIALRDRFVFKLIPCLNPDGVYHGHYRADTRGVNLNRKYLSATYEGHPSIVGSVAVARQLHSLRVLHLVVDIHAHAGRRGCFFYGNQQISPTNQAEAALFMNVVSLNTRWMAINGCTFFGCGSHDGSARAAFYRLTGLPLIFTLECNYNRGNAANELQRKVYEKEIDSGRISPEPPPLREISPKYDPAAWGDIGKAIALAVLDMTGVNPASRLGPLARRADDMRRLRQGVGVWAARMQAMPNQFGCPSDDENEEENAELAAALQCEEADNDEPRTPPTKPEPPPRDTSPKPARPSAQPASSPTRYNPKTMRASAYAVVAAAPSRRPAATSRSPPVRQKPARAWGERPSM